MDDIDFVVLSLRRRIHELKTSLGLYNKVNNFENIVKKEPAKKIENNSANSIRDKLKKIASEKQVKR